MEGFVATQVHDYQNGKISGRRLVEILTLAATAYAGNKAGAAEQGGLDAALVNHISYTCPDFRRAADWYSMVFNLDQVGATARDVALPFGKKGEKPYGVTADDVPLTHIICRTRPPDAPVGAGQPPRRQSKAVIDHIAITVADFDPDVTTHVAHIGEELHDRQAGRGLPTARLADDPDALALVDVEGDVIDGHHVRTPEVELGPQTLHLEDGAHR